MRLFGHRLLPGGHPHTHVAALHHVAAAGNALTVAGINGTILAIVIAALSGYIFMVYQSIHRMQTELIEHANATRRTATRPGILVVLDAPWDSGASFDDLRDVFVRLAMGMDPERDVEVPPPGEARRLEPWQPEGIDTRGETLLALMSQMPKKAPFAYDPKKDIKDLDGARSWLADVEDRIVFIAGIFRDCFMTIQPFVADAERRRVQRFAEREGSQMSAVMRSLVETRQTRSEMLSEFETWVEGYRRGVDEVRAAMEALRRYELRALPSRGLALSIAMAVLAVFVGGVAIPVVHPSVSDIVYAWFPVFLYAVALVIGLAAALRHVFRRQ